MKRLSILMRTLIYTILIPGSVVLFIPWLLINFWDSAANFGFFRYFGLLVMIVGLFFYLFAVAAFFSIKGTPMIFFMKRLEKVFGLEPDKLVSAGLYKYSRNPMYLGVVLLILGEGILFESVTLLIWGALCFVIFHFVVYYLEEPHLRQKHGPEYQSYLQNTPRWFGWPKEKRD
jgi:protein-S-isoprenylcysteine O-methyltransferase Ste14